MSAALPTVREVEEPVVALARALLEQVPEARLRPLLEPGRKMPARLSAGGLAVLEQTLSQGAVLFLARGGAWRKVGPARLWERFAPVPLVFTGASFHFLRWLLGIGDQADSAPMLPKQPLGTGDEVLLVAGLASTAGTVWQSALAWQPMVRASPLCAAGFAAELGAARALDDAPAFDLSPGGWHAFALEALVDVFSHRWAEAEFEKTHEPLPARLKGMALAQAEVLDALLEASRAYSARVPLTFLLEAGRIVLAAGVGAQAYGGGLTARSTVRERSEARQASAAFLRGLVRVAEMDQEHRQVRFTDDGYDVAQTLVAQWEALGPSRAQWGRVEPLLTELAGA